MPTRYITLAPEQNAFLDTLVEMGEYQSACEIICDALSMLQRRCAEDALKLKALRMHIKAGVAALGTGKFVEVADADLDGYLEGMMTAHSQRA